MHDVRNIEMYVVAFSFAITPVFLSLFQYLCIPFVLLSPAVADVPQAVLLNQSNTWIGELELADAGKWADQMLLLVRF